MGPSSASPFDFSDFGQRAPAAPARPQSRPAGAALGGGFDPFSEDAPAPVTRRDPAGGQAFADPETEQPNATVAAAPPVRLVVAALAVAVAGIVASAVVATTDTSIALAFVGWLLAGPAAIGGLAMFTHIDTRRRSHSVYSAPTWLSSAYWLVVTVCGLGVGVGAWQLALWAGRT